MAEPITSKQLGILHFIARNPNVGRATLVASKGATDLDLAYLAQHDMIREREPGCFHVSHFGDMVLKRSL